ncbi:uncharacterized protein LOC135847790 isoform X2 [Planococcus citri]|uniref:uncharacterized protein LOC135847790 isoform X2 n=1 Tax=Planococcus citri TaxID=170843 RepID=UPI0031F9529F
MVFENNCVGCGIRGTTGFFKFPENPSTRKLWLKKCGVDVSTPLALHARLCMKHFKHDDISHVNDRFILKKDAVPSMKVDPGKIHKLGRYKTSCYICGATYAESFHYVPKDTKKREAWLGNLGLKFGRFNPVPATQMLLCNSHFLAGDIIRHPYSRHHKLRRGAMPIDISQNARNNQTGQSTSSSKANGSKELSENSKVISVSRELLEKKGPDQSTISRKKKIDKIVTPTMTDLTSNGVRDSSILECKLEKKNKRIRRLKEKNARLKKESTSYLNLLMDFHAEVGDNIKRISRLKEGKTRLKNESKSHRALLDYLLMRKFVTKQGMQIIQAFRQASENPVQL